MIYFTYDKKKLFCYYITYLVLIQKCKQGFLKKILYDL